MLNGQRGVLPILRMRSDVRSRFDKFQPTRRVADENLVAHHALQAPLLTTTIGGGRTVGPLRQFLELSVDLLDNGSRAHTRERGPGALELSAGAADVAERLQRARQLHPGLAEIELKLLPLHQSEGFGESRRRRRRLIRRGRDNRLADQKRCPRIMVLLRHGPGRERHELAGFVDAALPNKRLGEEAVDVRRQPPTELERKRQHVAQPALGKREVAASDRVTCQRAVVLDLKVGVTRPLEPLKRLRCQLLRYLELAAVVLDEAEQRRGAGLIPVAAVLAGESERRAEPLLRLGKFAQIEERCAKT